VVAHGLSVPLAISPPEARAATLGAGRGEDAAPRNHRRTKSFIASRATFRSVSACRNRTAVARAASGQEVL